MSAAGETAARVARAIPTPVYIYGGIAIVGVAVIYWLANGGGRALGKASASAVTGVVTGATNDLLGVPFTDAAKCEAACAAGNTLDASLYCSIGRFSKYVIKGR